METDIAEEGVTSGGLSNRIITTLQLADRRGYSLSLPHLSRMLIHGEAHEEEVGREINGMHEVSNHDGICCLKGREHLIPETRGLVLKKSIDLSPYKIENKYPRVESVMEHCRGLTLICMQISKIRE